MRTLVLASLALAALAPPAHTRPPARPLAPARDTLPPLPADDRTRLAEAFRLADAHGERLFPGWRDAPFAVLLVTADHEYLLRHPRPSPDFTALGHDTILGTAVHVRRRVFSPTFLATFPAVGGVPTIVVGQPARTGLASTRWVLTVLHEHLHQLQYAQPGYYAGVAALDLARGDTTGMWMLDYPFPYDSATVRARLAEWTTALDRAITPLPAVDAARTSRSARDARLRAVLAARARLRDVLTPADDRYLAFQLWQEGVARYGELQFARRAAAAPDAPAAAFRALPDHASYGDAAAAIEREIRETLRDPKLERHRRVAFYGTGAALALVLDGASPGWRARYLGQPFALEPLLR